MGEGHPMTDGERGIGDWKRVLAFAVVVSSLAYCTAKEETARAMVKATCIEARGEWHVFWGGWCELPAGAARSR
jgi:hypothetical protein